MMALGIRLSTLNAIACLMWCASVAANPATAADLDNSERALWADGFHLPGLPFDFRGVATAEYRGQVYVGGYHDPRDPNATLIRWDGTRWSIVPGCPDGDIRSMCVFQDELVVGGSFDRVGSRPANNIARWNGHRWATLAEGIEAKHPRLLPHGNDLFVCTTSWAVVDSPRVRIARWDGAQWHSLAQDVDGIASALAWHHGDLVVGGDFDVIGGVQVGNLARWTGARWDSLPRLPRRIRSLAGIGDSLWASVEIDVFNQSPTVYVLSPTGWTATEPPLFGDVYRIGRFRGQVVVVGSELGYQDRTSGQSVLQWTGSSWTSVGSGVPSHYSSWFPGVDESAWDLCEVGGELTILGNFKRAGEKAVNGIAQWDGGRWDIVDRPGAGVPSFPQRVSAIGDDVFMVTVDGVLRWNHATWDSLPFESRTRIDVWNGQLVFGNGPVYAWDGSQTVQLGGFTNTLDVCVSNDTLYACGLFGSDPSESVRRWDGQDWVGLGEAFDRRVLRLFVHNGALIAIGSFNRIGSRSASCVARWNGSEWLSVEFPFQGYPRGVCEWNGRLVVGGSFTPGNPPDVWAWDGTQWDSLGPHRLSGVFAIAAHRGQLYIAGIMPGGVAAWTGTAWSSMGDGVNGTGIDLTSSPDGLVVVGAFDRAGGKPSYRVARWDAPRSPAPQSVIALAPAAPNPTRARTVFSYSLTERSWVRLRLYDVAGRSIRSLFDGAQDSGPHYGVWDGLDDRGRRARPGVYLARLEAGGVTRSQRVVRIE